MVDSKHIDSLHKSKKTAKDMGTLGFEDSDLDSLLLLNRVFRVGTDQTGQYLDIEPVRMQYERQSSEHTTRATTRQTGVRRKTESDSEKRGCHKIQIWLYETFILGPRPRE